MSGYVCCFTFVCAAAFSDHSLMWVLGCIPAFLLLFDDAHHERRASYTFLGGVFGCFEFKHEDTVGFVGSTRLVHMRIEDECLPACSQLYRCYDWTSLTRRYIGLHHFLSHFPHTEALYDTIWCVFMYDTILSLAWIR